MYSNTVRVFYLFGVSGLLVLYFDVTLLVVSCFDYLCFPTCAGVHYETVQHAVLVFVDFRERHSQCARMLRAPPGNRNILRSLHWWASERGTVNVHVCCAGPPVTEIFPRQPQPVVRPPFNVQPYIKKKTCLGSCARVIIRFDYFCIIV